MEKYLFISVGIIVLALLVFFSVFSGVIARPYLELTPTPAYFSFLPMVARNWPPMPIATATVNFTPTGTPTAVYTPTPTETPRPTETEIPWRTVWFNEGTREVGPEAWTHIADVGFGGIVEELNYDPAGFGTTKALKETFTGPPVYRPGEYNRRAQLGKDYYSEGGNNTYVHSPWKLGNTVYYDSSMAPALFNNGQDLRCWTLDKGSTTKRRLLG